MIRSLVVPLLVHCPDLSPLFLTLPKLKLLTVYGFSLWNIILDPLFSVTYVHADFVTPLFSNICILMGVRVCFWCFSSVYLGGPLPVPTRVQGKAFALGGKVFPLVTLPVVVLSSESVSGAPA